MTSRILFGLAFAFYAISAPAATITECKHFLRVGKYVACLDAATDSVNRRSYGEDWPILKAEAEIQLGRYSQASQSIDAGIQRYAWSIRLRMKAYRLARMLGEREKAQRLLAEINRLATDSPWRYTDADDLVALGEAAIALGADPRDVLDGFFDRARRNYKSRPDGHVAAGRLAIEKGDMALAAEILRPAAEQFEEDPETLFLLATAIGSVEPEKAAALMQQALTINERFAPGLLHLAERQIDSEAYSQAETILDRILETNAWHPKAHALHAVIHHLQNQPLEEAKSYSLAIAFSGPNAVVDHLIGERLSRKYRFAEGAQYQRQALQADPLFLPAKTQLAQDLLRLGMDERGWQLANEAQKQDKYSTTLFNLMSLKDSLSEFKEIRNERFIIRMDRSEAEVYGSHVESLLNSAFETLSQKYGYTPDEPVVVEIFDRKDDFAVRTFGIPDVAGFLGVCFGKLITANSPASQRESPNNWESVLWHEFCHVITLQMTENRIPRWLSEGISVYEERLRNRRWGKHMSPGFRKRILEGEITRVSKLSSAFLNSKSAEDLDFAYYESSMVVEFIVQEYGFESLAEVLGELKNGFTINDALDRHAGGLDTLDAAFDDYLKKQAQEYAKGVIFEFDAETNRDVAQFSKEHPKNYTAGMGRAAGLMREGNLQAAEEQLLHLVKLFPSARSGNSARRMLAVVYERMEMPERQAKVLTEHLNWAGDDLDAAMTLLTLQFESQQWKAAVTTGRQVMAIDPLQPTALRKILRAALESGEKQLAIRLLSGLLELDPADAPRFHYQLARLILPKDSKTAKRHVLLALEQAPRYRDAHRLLLQLQESE